MIVYLGKCRVLELELLTKDQVQPRTQLPPSESDDDEDAFFRSRRIGHNVNVQDVVANYLHDASDRLASLDVWPSLNPTFIKLNTPLPASAACETL